MLLTLFGIAILILLTVSCVTYLCFWLNARGTAHWDTLARMGGGHPWAIVARGFCSSLLAQAAATVLHPITLAKALWLTPGGKARPGSRPPVLFVHGYTHSASAWVLFAGWFRKAGYTDLHAITYNSFSVDFEGIVAHVERAAAAILDARPGSRIILVGHSLGGLAIRQMLNTSPLRSRVLAAATLGSPHKGTALSRLAMNRLGRSLAYKGPLVRRIESADTPPPAPCLAVYSLVDNMVMPLDGLLIEAPGWRCEPTPPVCHVGLLYHRPTARLVLEFADAAVAADAVHRARDSRI